MGRNTYRAGGGGEEGRHGLTTGRGQWGEADFLPQAGGGVGRGGDPGLCARLCASTTLRLSLLSPRMLVVSVAASLLPEDAQ